MAPDDSLRGGPGGLVVPKTSPPSDRLSSWFPGLRSRWAMRSKIDRFRNSHIFRKRLSRRPLTSAIIGGMASHASVYVGDIVSDVVRCEDWVVDEIDELDRSALLRGYSRRVRGCTRRVDLSWLAHRLGVGDVRVKRWDEVRAERQSESPSDREIREFRIMRALPFVERPKLEPPKLDPLDVTYDGQSLRMLLEFDQRWRRHERSVGWDLAGGRRALTESQRTAISAHWSAELREKQRAALELELARDRNQVVVDLDW